MICCIDKNNDEMNIEAPWNSAGRPLTNVSDITFSLFN
jgi:hypothetical protein